MLARTLGPGKAQVQVNADLNVDQTTKNELIYGKKGVPLKTTEETEKLRGSGAAERRPAGTGSNIPTYSAGSRRQQRQQHYDHKTGTTDYGVDKTVSQTRSRPARSTSSQVALLVDKSVPPAAVHRHPDGGRERRRPRHDARRHASRPSRSRSPRPRRRRRARCRRRCSAAQVGRPRPGRADLLLLHGARHQAARVRDARPSRPGCARSRPRCGSPSSRPARPPAPLPARQPDESMHKLDQLDGARARARRRPGPPWMSED